MITGMATAIFLFYASKQKKGCKARTVTSSLFATERTRTFFAMMSIQHVILYINLYSQQSTLSL